MSYADDLTETFFVAIERDRPKRKHGIHVSDILNPCLRRSWYSLNLGVEEYNRTTALNFWVGRKLHETPILTEHELELEAYGVHATIDEYGDGLLLDKKNLLREVPLPPTPSGRHINQVEYYTVILEANNRPVDAVFILFIPVFKLTEGPIFVDVTGLLRSNEKIVQEIQAKVKTLERQPPRFAGDECVYCPYFVRCFRE